MDIRPYNWPCRKDTMKLRIACPLIFVSQRRMSPVIHPKATTVTRHPSEGNNLTNKDRNDTKTITDFTLSTAALTQDSESHVPTYDCSIHFPYWQNRFDGIWQVRSCNIRMSDLLGNHNIRAILLYIGWIYASIHQKPHFILYMYLYFNYNNRFNSTYFKLTTNRLPCFDDLHRNEQNLLVVEEQ